MTNYDYRADGMRVRKQVGGNVTRSYYDGQMPIEEEVKESLSGNLVSLTQNFIGARSIEAMTVDSGSGAVTSYPLYDTHGNMIATVRSLSGGTAWDIYDERNYDVWGSVRQGATTGGPKGRYVANLGHVQDDESGLVYMRARYYEPESGRFLSRDLKMAGNNWYAYAYSNPVNCVDLSGNEPANYIAFGALLGLFSFGMLVNSLGAIYVVFGNDPVEIGVGYTMMTIASVMMTIGSIFMDMSWESARENGLLFIAGLVVGQLMEKCQFAAMVGSAHLGKRFGGVIAGIAFANMIAYNMVLISLLAAITVEELL